MFPVASYLTYPGSIFNQIRPVLRKKQHGMAVLIYIVTGLSKCVLHTYSPTLRTLSISPPLCQGIPGSVWKLGRLNHIAIAVPDMEKATALYRDVLGAQVSDKVPLPEHGVYTVFVELGNTKLELLHPLGEKSPIAGFLQKNKSGGMHHICIEVSQSEQCCICCSAHMNELYSLTLSLSPHLFSNGIICYFCDFRLMISVQR